MNVILGFNFLYDTLLLIYLLQCNSPFGKAELYQKLEQLGEGSYATVFKGISR